MKRFQQCNVIEKFWRLRWYIPVPFLFIYRLIFPIKIYEDKLINNTIVPTDKHTNANGSELWDILVSNAEMKMNWFLTNDEAINKLK